MEALLLQHLYNNGYQYSLLAVEGSGNKTHHLVCGFDRGRCTNRSQYESEEEKEEGGKDVSRFRSVNST